MQELYKQISERFERVQEVIKEKISSSRFRQLKQEQKVRVEKQNFIISMMRANKNTQIISKKLIYNYSYEIMKKINSEFKHQMNWQKFEDNFLNDFVGLYRHFFQKYEEMFNFKLKVQSLIRPTNHNLIIDLIKYLIEFSRDFYQQTFYWQMRNNNKIEDSQDLQNKDMLEVKLKKRNQKIGNRASLNQIIFQKPLLRKIQQQQNILSIDPQKNFDILEVHSLPVVISQPKDPRNNVQVLKMRINEFYRQMKSRNTLIKSSCQSYYTIYHGEKPSMKERQGFQMQDERMNRISHPFLLSLVVQKSGFNFINVVFSQNRYFSRNKEKKLSPLKVSQKINPHVQNKPKMQFLLTSSKIIRISQNFLPPLQYQINKTINDTNSQHLPHIVSVYREKVLSSNSTGTDFQKQKNSKVEYMHRESSEVTSQVRLLRKDSIKRATQLKRSFNSEDKKIRHQKQKPNLINKQGNPQEKILHWLQKLRQIKQLEHKKVMGLI